MYFNDFAMLYIFDEVVHLYEVILGNINFILNKYDSKSDQEIKILLKTKIMRD